MYDLSWDEVLRRESAAGRYPYLNQTLRTMHIDAKIRAVAAEGLDELVILGAGLDSRAYRMAEELARTRVFEVDFPPTQEDKKRRVKAALSNVPSNVTYVGIDFAKQTLEKVLLAVGHRPSAKALFLMEGVMVYLPVEAVSSTLRYVSKNSAPGSGIVFDYFDRRLLDGEGQTPLYKSTTNLFRSWGEPQTFGIPGYDSRRFAEQHGLRLRSDYTFGELCAIHTPRLDAAALDYRRLYYRIGHAVVS
jgi:methyltransferase (TIGR00027 family)